MVRLRATARLYKSAAGAFADWRKSACRGKRNRLMIESENLRNRAEAIFRKKTVALREHERAMEEYKLEQRAMQEKTARLKALRLARDAIQKKTGAENP